MCECVLAPTNTKKIAGGGGEGVVEDMMICNEPRGFEAFFPTRGGESIGSKRSRFANTTENNVVHRSFVYACVLAPHFPSPFVISHACSLQSILLCANSIKKKREGRGGGNMLY